MSYQVLARKYRPKGFDTLVGQEHVVRALSHALESGRLHHAYLFTGTRGVGKTTLSRILAKAFNCQGIDGNGGVTSKPCGQCDACVAIDGGRFVDYIEIDAASNRGVDEMAQLLEQAVYAPSNARFKVYMIDEVHMLTNHAFNAMLKTLEEPPAHVKFILATTDPQKIPVTVLSRCLQFNLKQMPPSQIVAHLIDVLGQEQITFETPALRLLAQGAHGSMRDALSLTDQAIAYAAGNVTLEAVQAMLGALDQSFLIQIVDALAQRDGPTLIAIAEDMAVRSLSYNAALQDLGSLLHRIALGQSVPSAIADDLPERNEILRLAALFDAEEIQLFYQIVVHGRNELGLAPDDFAGFSMTLLRMLAFRPGIGSADGGVAPVAPVVTGAPSIPSSTVLVSKKTPSSLVIRDDDRAHQTSSLAKEAASSSLAHAEPAPSARPISPARAALNAALSGSKSSRSVRDNRPAALSPSRPIVPPDVSSKQKAFGTESVDLAPAPPWDEEFETLPAAVESGALASVPLPIPKMTVAGPISLPTPAKSSVKEVVVEKKVKTENPPVFMPVPELGWDGNWPQLATHLGVRGVVQQLAHQSELVRCEHQGEITHFTLRVAIETLRSASSIEKLSTVLADHFAKPVRIETELGPVTHSANALLMVERAERQRQAEQTMHDDPFIQTLSREFGATIVPGSIKPISLN